MKIGNKYIWNVTSNQVSLKSMAMVTSDRKVLDIKSLVSEGKLIWNLFTVIVSQICCPVAKSCPTLWPPWPAACQTSLSFTTSQSLFKLMSIELMMPSNHLILCHPILLLPSIFPSIRVFSNESALCIKWTILEWVAISFSRRSSQPRDRTRNSRIAGKRFTNWATREVQKA